MRRSDSVVVPAPPAEVFSHVARLEAYPPWLRLVHSVVVTDGDHEVPAWEVELRARVGPFARSKRLRMIRVECVPDRLAVFERNEIDDRQHAMWALRVELEPVADGTQLTMHLAYDGAHWTGSVLERVLADEVARARKALAALVTTPTP